mgnify:CR=1 FL=1
MRHACMDAHASPRGDPLITFRVWVLYRRSDTSAEVVTAGQGLETAICKDGHAAP